MKRKILASLLAIGMATGAAQATTSLSFIIDGDTFDRDFAFSNDSDAGEMLTAFGIDLSGAGDFCFDTVGGGPCNSDTGQAATPFSATSGTDLITGLTSNTVVDGGTTLDLSFNDFDAGEGFMFLIDVDRGGDGGFTVLGSDLIGATAFADFDNGKRLVGVFAAVDGNDDASAFTVTEIIDIPAVPLPASLPLLAAGIGLLGFARRRASKKS